MMNDATYRIIAWAFDAFLWGGDLEGGENLEGQRPAVFVANHLGAMGPIAVIASLPLRVYPWVIPDILDNDLAADYLNEDFVEPGLHLSPPLSLWVSRGISKISVRLLRSAGCIAVWRGKRLHDTYMQSLDLLTQGKNLLLFPEDASREMDPRYQMAPFRKGFTRLGERYYQRTGSALDFVPLAVHLETRRVRVGLSIRYNPGNKLANERLRIKRVIEKTVHTLYLEMAMDAHMGVPLRH